MNDRDRQSATTSFLPIDEYFIPLDEFLRETGLSHSDVEVLLSKGRLIGGYDTDDLLRGVRTIRGLPAPEELRDWGMTPAAHYGADRLRVTVESGEPDLPDDAVGFADWAFGWE